MIDKIIELESDSSQSISSISAQSSSMFQTGAYFSCAPDGGWQVGAVKKTVSAGAQKIGAVRKTTKGAAKSVKWEPAPSPPPSKASVADSTQPATGRSSRKRPSTSDSLQIPDAKKPRGVATRSSTRNNKPKPLASVAIKIKPITKVAVKAAAGPKKSKSTARTRQSKGNTRVKAQKIKSVAVRRSSCRSK